MAIDPVGGAARASLAPRPGHRVGGGGFRLPEQARAQAAAPAGEVALTGMLALQEVETAEQRDRAARRRGRDLLAELAALQRELLAVGGEEREPGDRGPALARLARLSRSVPCAADPALTRALAAIVLRSRVELARYGHDYAEMGSSPPA